MKLLEYEAKEILRAATIAVPDSYLLHSQDDKIERFPVVLKSQVPTGGRGKRGGIVMLDKANNTALKDLFARSINGFTPKTILAEEKLSIKKEFYLSLLVDRASSRILLLAAEQGGIEVEEADRIVFLKISIQSKSDLSSAGLQLAELYHCPEKEFLLQEIVEKLYGALIAYDATLIEINPLILTTDKKIIAGDCKIELDDAAAFRHHDWKFETIPANANFVTLDENGTVATIANGAGLAMATVDAVAASGCSPANFLDIGGGANEASVLAAFQKITEYKNVRAVVINVFAGITKCDEIARAVIAARAKIPALPALYIRLAGTNYNEAKQLLDEQHILLLPSLEACITTLIKEQSL